MTQQFYVSPEQIMKDRADFARKGIARGRSVVVLGFAGGIALVAENPSPTLHKLGEIYDRIAFAAVGKYNEFESLRQAGVRYADVRGYSYDRVDVTARGLASVYAQSLGSAFTAEQKPFEVELAVAEVGRSQEEDSLFRLNFDGSITDERGFLAMGGRAELVQASLAGDWRAGAQLPEVLRWAVQALAAPRAQSAAAPVDAAPTGAGQTGAAQTGAGAAGAGPAVLDAAMLEVAVLDRGATRTHGSHRAFHRLSDAEVAGHLAPASG